KPTLAQLEGKPLTKGGVGHVGGQSQRSRVVSAPEAILRSGAAGPLPLRLGRQPITHALLLAQPAAEGLGIVPTDVHHRQLVVLGKTGVRPVGAWAGDELAAGRAEGKAGAALVACLLDEPAILAHRHLVRAEIERAGDPL